MGIVDGYVRAWTRTGRVQGRATPRELWTFAVVHLAVCAPGLLALITPTDAIASLTFAVTGCYLLASAPAVVCLLVRRLHDVDQSGWVLLGALTLPVPWLNMLFLLALFILVIQPGTRGPNRYGADPRSPRFIVITGPDNRTYAHPWEPGRVRRRGMED